MTVQKLETADGFVVYDYPDAPASGLVRRGRKILQRSATDLARSATYAFAFHEVRRGGASAGLNAEGDAEAPALQALLTEFDDPLATGELELFAGKRLHADELTGADAAEGEQLLGVGVVAAAEWALGQDLSGVSLAIEGDSDNVPGLSTIRQMFTDRGATVLAPDSDAKPWEIWSSDVDLLLTGSKPGAMNHQGAETVKAKVVVPWGPIPISTKALAVLLRRGVTYIPDFVSATGPLLGRHVEAENEGQSEYFAAETARRLELAAQASDEPLFVACCLAAERFLDSWQDHRPFGRPLAG